MALLDQTLNNAAQWQGLLTQNRKRVEVDLNEVERVLELARRTPGLSSYGQGLRQLSVFFSVATDYYRANAPEELAGLIAFWERYRDAVVQRYAGVTPVVLRAADAVVENVFDRFLQNVPNDRIAYSDDAHPLVYGGEGGLGGYYTHPPGWNRPFAIINLPHAAFDNVWQWLALAHETGHDLYATVDGLEAELTQALADRMRKAVDDGDVVVPDVNVDLTPHGVPYTIQYSRREFLAKVWASWADEAQADLIGLLSCGGAAAVALQQIIGFSNEDVWFLEPDGQGGIGDGPEPHPTGWVRNALNIAALRLIGGGHQGIADELQTRFQSLRPAAQDIVWKLEFLTVAEVPVAEMVTSAQIAAEVLVNHQLQAFGGKSYDEVATFTSADQGLVEQLIAPLVAGDATFNSVEGFEPRHLLAATAFALEDDRQSAETINRTFQHFVGV